MSRERRKKQEYDLGENVTVVILYPADHKPPMLHDDDAAVVSRDRDKFDAYTRGVRPGYIDAGYRVPPAELIPGRSRDMSPAERVAALERIGEKELEKPRPMSSEDVFRAAGVDTQILSAIARAAETD